MQIQEKFSASKIVMKMVSCQKCIIAVSLLVDLVGSASGAILLDVVMRLNGCVEGACSQSSLCCDESRFIWC